MNFDSLIVTLIDLFNQNRIVAIAIMAGLGFYAFFRPQKAFRLAGLVAFVIGTFYLAGMLTDSISSGARQKDRMVNKSKPYLDE